MIPPDTINWNFAKDAARISNGDRPRCLHFSSLTVLLIHLFVCIRMCPQSSSFLFIPYIDLLPEEREEGRGGGGRMGAWVGAGGGRVRVKEGIYK